MFDPKLKKEAIGMIPTLQEMEAACNRCRAAVDALTAALEAFDAVQDDLRVLDAYLGSDDWFSQLEADEQGLLPPDLPRGVLAEDTLYDLLEEADALRNRVGTAADS